MFGVQFSIEIILKGKKGEPDAYQSFTKTIPMPSAPIVGQILTTADADELLMEQVFYDADDHVYRVELLDRYCRNRLDFDYYVGEFDSQDWEAVG